MTAAKPIADATPGFVEQRPEQIQDTDNALAQLL
jgi:hypothetical protein